MNCLEAQKIQSVIGFLTCIMFAMGQMDADYDPSQASYTSGKKKKKSKFKQLIEKKKPTFEEGQLCLLQQCVAASNCWVPFFYMDFFLYIYLVVHNIWSWGVNLGACLEFFWYFFIINSFLVFGFVFPSPF